MNADDRSIIALVQKICMALSKDNASIQEVTSIIGVPDRDKSVLNQCFVSPRDQLIEEAYIVAKSTNLKIPSNVTMDLKEPSPVSLEQMEKTFGPSKAAPPNPNGMIFRAWITTGSADSKYSCAIFATLAKNESNVVKITIRRDKIT